MWCVCVLLRPRNRTRCCCSTRPRASSASGGTTARSTRSRRPTYSCSWCGSHTHHRTDTRQQLAASCVTCLALAICLPVCLRLGPSAACTAGGELRRRDDRHHQPAGAGRRGVPAALRHLGGVRGPEREGEGRALAPALPATSAHRQGWVGEGGPPRRRRPRLTMRRAAADTAALSSGCWCCVWLAGLDFDLLGRRYALSGGHIKSAVRRAAMRAALRPTHQQVVR